MLRKKKFRRVAANCSIQQGFHLASGLVWDIYLNNSLFTREIKMESELWKSRYVKVLEEAEGILREQGSGES